MVETFRHASKVQRYDQIYEEVRALRKETRHSVQDLRERFKEKGVIQNKDQFIVKLIAQVRGGKSRALLRFARETPRPVSALGFTFLLFLRLFAFV